MRKTILLVEDSPHKRVKLVEALSKIIPDAPVTEACSFSAGSKAIETGAFSLAIIDMTLPTYDRADDEPGGRMRPFGGREIARKVVKRNLTDTKLLFITQYRSFSDNARSHTFSSLREELKTELGDYFLGMILFDTSQSEWRKELSVLLTTLK